jgi:hypothetical protein
LLNSLRRPIGRQVLIIELRDIDGLIFIFLFSKTALLPSGAVGGDLAPANADSRRSATLITVADRNAIPAASIVRVRVCLQIGFRRTFLLRVPRIEV